MAETIVPFAPPSIVPQNTEAGMVRAIRRKQVPCALLFNKSSLGFPHAIPNSEVPDEDGHADPRE